MRFYLKIDSSNDAVKTADDVAHLLSQVAEKLRGNDQVPDEMDPFDRSGSVRDVNGNTVGKWEVKS